MTDTDKTGACEGCGVLEGQSHFATCPKVQRADKTGARTRYCRDCRHITLPGPGQYDLATCAHLLAATMPTDHLVSGEGERTQRYCSTMRQGRCGEEGLLWEKRNG